MSKISRKSLIVALALIVLCAAVAGLALAFGGRAFADGIVERQLSVSGITVTNGSKKVDGAYSDPVTHYDDSAAGALVNQEIRFSTASATDAVIYTAYYPKTTTDRTGDIVEYACEPDGTSFKVTSVTDGSTYIPVGGFVLSLPKSSYSGFAKTGDMLKLGGTKLTIPTMAVESEGGKRIVVDKTNSTRSAPMVVYYDYQFGKKTGTNVFGTEMTCTYDFDENTFKVVSFRGFGMGDDSGSDIPDNSFVLSAYGEGYRGQLVKKQLFEAGDAVKMVGFDFIRFGGTVYGTYDFVNPTPEENPKGMETESSPFPAYRGDNQTILYKYGWDYNGAAGTGTNIYGYEAAVDANGVVVELNVNVSKIPEGGYVLSGHGKGRDFLRSNMVLGATVVLNEEAKTFAISTTLNSYYQNLVSEAEKAIASAETKIKQLYDINSEAINAYKASITTKLAELKTIKEEVEAGADGWTEKVKLNKLMTYNLRQLEIENLYQSILTMSTESKVVSARATWHRPTEMTYAAIEETVKTYHDIGINLIFVETLYSGYSSARTDSEDFPYNPKLAAKYDKDSETKYPDYASAFVACCKEYGIEVHAWVENFYVGTLNNVPVLQNHPDWIMYNDDGTYLQRIEGGKYIFIDPANGEVRASLIAYYKDLFRKIPDLAGLNLDYIRYAVSNETQDTGFTVAAMEGFYKLKGLTFTDAQAGSREKMYSQFKKLFNVGGKFRPDAEAEANYKEWEQYRTDIITAYVKQIKTEIKDKEGKLLSTSVFSDPDTKRTKKQDWQTWLKNGWIDIATPMAYYNDSTDVLVNVNAMIQSAGSNCYYYSGLASSYSGLPAYRNTDQIEAAYIAGSQGYVIFCSTQIIGHDDVQEVLSSGVNSKKGILPHADTDKILKAYFDDILDKADRIYIPAGGMNAEKKAALAAEFDKISAMKLESAVDIKAVMLSVNKIGKGVSAYASGYSGRRIAEQLTELETLLDTKISTALISSGEWNPEENPARPEVVVPGMEEEPPEQTTPITSDTDTKPKDDDKGVNVGALVGGIVGGVAAIAIIAVVVVIVLKKKKKN